MRTTLERPSIPAALDEPVNKLCKALAGGAVGIDKLPKAVQEVAVLAAADRAGLIEFGVREHAWHGEKWDWDKHTAQTRTTERVLHVGQNFNWSSLCTSGRKPLGEIIDQHAQGDKKLQLHVRLTSDGEIRAAAMAD